MLHGTKTLNTRGLEPRKLKDKEGKVVTDRQRNKLRRRKTVALTIRCPTKLLVKAARKGSMLGRSNALPILTTNT